MEVPLLLVLTSRPELDPAWPEPNHLIRLELGRLSRREAQRLLDQISDEGDLPRRALSQSMQELILVKTDGVPLFVEEMVRALAESDDWGEGEPETGRSGGSFDSDDSTRLARGTARSSRIRQSRGASGVSDRAGVLLALIVEGLSAAGRLGWTKPWIDSWARD